MALFVAVTNRKGGTSKTQTVFNLLYYLYDKGFKVLGVDLDSQCNLTKQFKEDPISKEDFTIGSIKQIHDGLDIIPGSKQIPDIVSKLSISIDRDDWLYNNLLKQYEKKYDVVVVDTSPAIDPLNISAYFCSDFILIPLLPDDNSIEGFIETKGYIQQVQMKNPSLEYRVILHKYRPDRSMINNYIMPLLKDEKYILVPDRIIFSEGSLGIPALDLPEVEKAFEEIAFSFLGEKLNEKIKVH